MNNLSNFAVDCLAATGISADSSIFVIVAIAVISGIAILKKSKAISASTTTLLAIGLVFASLTYGPNVPANAGTQTCETSAPDPSNSSSSPAALDISGMTFQLGALNECVVANNPGFKVSGGYSTGLGAPGSEFTWTVDSADAGFSIDASGIVSFDISVLAETLGTGNPKLWLGTREFTLNFTVTDGDGKTASFTRTVSVTSECIT